jgi:hypothetical protein
VAVQTTGAEKPYFPPKSRNLTLVAFEADASRVVDPDSVAPFEGIKMLVVGGFPTVMPTPELYAVPPDPEASDTRV